MRQQSKKQTKYLEVPLGYNWLTGFYTEKGKKLKSQRNRKKSKSYDETPNH